MDSESVLYCVSYELGQPSPAQTKPEANLPEERIFFNQCLSRCYYLETGTGSREEDSGTRLPRGRELILCFRDCHSSSQKGPWPGSPRVKDQGWKSLGFYTLVTDKYGSKYSHMLLCQRSFQKMCRGFGRKPGGS